MNENSTPQLKVSPMSVSFDLNNDSNYDGVLTITNDTNSDMKIEIYVSPYYVDENYNPIFTVDNDYTKLSDWVYFEDEAGDLKTEYTEELTANEVKEIKYHIAMPSNAEDFSQYAMIFVESKGSNTENIGGVLINSRVGILMSGRTGSLKLVGSNADSDGDSVTGEIGEINLASFMLSGNVKIETNVKNSGTVALDAIEKVTVRNIFGAELYNVENIVEIMPETTRDVEVEWEATPILGILNVDYSVTAGDNVISGSQTVFKIPVIIIIAGILIIFALIFSGIRVLKNRKKLTGKYFSFKNNRERHQSRRNRRSKIRWSWNRKKDCKNQLGKDRSQAQ